MTATLKEKSKDGTYEVEVHYAADATGRRVEQGEPPAIRTIRLPSDAPNIERLDHFYSGAPEIATWLESQGLSADQFSAEAYLMHKLREQRKFI